MVAERDEAPPVQKSVERIGSNVRSLTMKAVAAGHWAMWEKPDEVNEILRNWIQSIIFGETGSKL